MLNTQKQPKAVDQTINEYALKKRREYHREYRRNHPEKVKQWRKNYLVNAYKRMMQQEGVEV